MCYEKVRTQYVIILNKYIVKLESVGLEEGDVGGSEIVGSTPKLPSAVELYLFDLCPPGEMFFTSHCIKLRLQVEREDYMTHCAVMSFIT